MSKEKRSARAEEIKKCRHEMNYIESREQRLSSKAKYAELGLCAQCEQLHAETTQYGTKRHWCVALNKARRIYTTDPIVDCTNFLDRSQMPLAQMYSMAYLIEAKIPKKIGFILTNREEYDPEGEEDIDD